MENDEILKLAQESAQHPDDDKKVAGGRRSFLIFTIGEDRYALPAGQVREIISESELYYIPFVPSYVRGLINRHGEPYTVIDCKVILEHEALQADKYLILKMENDQMALLISDVLEIVQVPESDIFSLPAHDAFTGSLKIGATEIFIIDLQSIVKRLSNDL